MTRSDVMIMMTAWRRPQYLRKALSTWGTARGVQELEIQVCLEPSDRQDQMIQVIDDARERYGLNISVHVNPERLGVLVNPAVSVERLLRERPELEYVILAEEDLIVSDDVLEYLLWAKEEFRDQEEVLIVCAHSPDNATKDSDPDEVVLGQRFRCWIWGTWRDRWEKTIGPTWDYSYASGDHEAAAAGWDWNLDLRVIPRGGFKTVLPACSRSQNIGKFEGVHADPAAYVSTINPSFRPEYGKRDYQVTGLTDAGFYWPEAVMTPQSL